MRATSDGREGSMDSGTAAFIVNFGEGTGGTEWEERKRSGEIWGGKKRAKEIDRGMRGEEI